jgi:DNA-binding response OmpR family regulator
MTREMAFECLLVSPDPAVFTTIDGILHDFSIATKVCPYPARAAHLLAEGSTDLIVIDLEAENASEFLRQIATRTRTQKPTVLAVSGADCVALAST